MTQHGMEPYDYKEAIASPIIMDRVFSYAGKTRMLSVSRPKRDNNAYATRVRLSSEQQIIWEHEIYGTDSMQAVLLALDFARQLLTAEGGYTFGGNDDLMLPKMS